MVKRKIFNEIIGKNWTVINSIGLISLIGGVFLILEHYFKWGTLDLTDFPIGHEYTSLLLIVLGFVLMSKQVNNVLLKIIKRKKKKK